MQIKPQNQHIIFHNPQQYSNTMDLNKMTKSLAPGLEWNEDAKFVGLVKKLSFYFNKLTVAKSEWVKLFLSLSILQGVRLQ